MNATLRHRGPDGEGYLLNPPAHLAMRRLAIIDLTTGDQPIFNEDGTIGIIFNGEIFNYQELRRELLARSHRLATQSDTETIVHAYEEWGDDCPTHLNGQFAFAIWDRPRQRLFIARDHLGIKPLYYAPLGSGLLFGSELKALQAHPGCPQQVDPIALDQYLALRYIPAPRTIYQGVFKLPPAHTLVWQDGQVTLQRYWDFTFAPVDDRSEEEWAAELRALVADAVRRQMVADVPVGAFLSGGIDSSVIVALMAQTSATPVRTFSVVFPAWPQFDESRYARLVAERYATEHEEIAIVADAARDLPALVAAFDEPFADPAALPTLLMARITRQQVTVVLSGEGADELFAGYTWYGWAGRRWPLPASLRRPLHRLVQRCGQGRRGVGTLTARLAPDLETMLFDSALASVAPTHVRPALYAPEWRDQLGRRRLSDDFPFVARLAPDVPEQSRMQELDMKIWLEGDPLPKMDRTTMAASLEGRVPFLDYRLVELAARIPPFVHRRRGQSKALLRHACADLLPAEILARPKQSFDVPIAAWLRGDLYDLADEHLVGDGLRALPMLDREFIAARWGEHQSGRRNHGRLLWTLLMLSLWAERQR
jgi:asparagine synthase (glutamine-hydrolysing)